MSVARFAALLFIIMTSAAAAEPTPADLGKELVRVMSENPPGFTLVHADEKPTASVDGHKGYRIVLRQEIESMDATQQQIPTDVPVQSVMRTVIKWSHIDLVLIPDAERVTSGLRKRIKWQDLAQEYYVKPVYMGKGHGYHWFGRTTLFWQDDVRRVMKLNGGDDRIILALEGLEDDRDVMTRDSMDRIFRAFGDSAVPALQAAVRKHEKDNPFWYMHMLGEIQTDRSTAALRAFYRSKSPNVSGSSASVLASSSVRPAAKPEYLDMLRRRYEVNLVARKCAQSGWTEAIPDLEAVIASPPSWSDFESAYAAHRKLTGRPVSDAVLESWQRFDWLGSDGVAARAALGKSEDREAAAVCIIGQYGRYGKITGNQPEMHDRTVLEILGKLPIEIVRPLVETAARCADEYDKKRFTKLLDEL